MRTHTYMCLEVVVDSHVRLSPWQRTDETGGERTLVDVAGGHGLVGALAAIFKGKELDRVRR